MYAVIKLLQKHAQYHVCMVLSYSNNKQYLNLKHFKYPALLTRYSDSSRRYTYMHTATDVQAELRKLYLNKCSCAKHAQYHVCMILSYPDSKRCLDLKHFKYPALLARQRTTLLRPPMYFKTSPN
jgi:hypothetical protein